MRLTLKYTWFPSLSESNRHLGFLGSPTILINQRDAEREADSRAAHQGHCRIYKNELFEYPPKELTREALMRFK